MQVESWLVRAAAIAPSKAAIEAPEGRLSYAQLLAAARADAQALRGRGVKRGERVAIALPAGMTFASALHACLLLGAIAVPVDLRLKEDERWRIAAGARLVVDEPLAAVAGDGPASVGELEEPGLQGGESPAWPQGGEPRPPAPERHELDAPAVVIHTSGTTSQPKPVELTYGNLLWSALGSAVALGLDPDERWLCALPLSHVGGLSILVRSAIYATTAVVHERFETERALTALQREGITLVSLVATTLARLLDAGLSRPPRLRCALTGGGPVPAALLERAQAAGVPVRETYGLTECCSQAATAPAAADAPQGAGVPLFCTCVKIAEDGEILLSGPTVAPAALAGDRWLHTGDLGRLDERGFLHVVGRKADTIVTGGENVSPAEVEAAIEVHPAVLEAAVLGRPDPQWGEAVCAIVVVAPGASVEEAQLSAHCAAALAPFKVPKRFTLVSEPLPRTRSGKLLRRELR
jgi:o-succinylbenzoate---CoA ligase